MHPFHDCAEGAQGELGDFEELLSERDADDRDAQGHPEQEIDQRQLQPADQEPHHVQQERHRPALIADFLPERVQGDARQLEALQADRNPDDRHAPHAARQHPPERAEKPAADDPQDVEDDTHEQRPPYCVAGR